MRIKKVVRAIAEVLVCIVIIASILFVSGQKGRAWLSVQYQSGGTFVAVHDKEEIRQLREAVKEVMHQGQKVDAADYETTYGSSLFLVNWICPVQVKGAYPKRVAGQRDDKQNGNDGQRSVREDMDNDRGDGYLVQIGLKTYQISEEQYDTLLAAHITALYENGYCEDKSVQAD